MKSVCGLCTCACMCTYVHVCEVTSSLTLHLLCEQRSLSEPWAHQLGSLTGHLSVAIHVSVSLPLWCVRHHACLFTWELAIQTQVLTLVQWALYLQSVFPALQRQWSKLLLLDSAEGDTLHRSTAVEFFVASTTYLSQTLMRDYNSLTHCWRAHMTKCNSSCDPNQVITIWWPSDDELWFHVIQTFA